MRILATTLAARVLKAVKTGKIYAESKNAILARALAGKATKPEMVKALKLAGITLKRVHVGELLACGKTATLATAVSQLQDNVPLHFSDRAGFHISRKFAVVGKSVVRLRD